MLRYTFVALALLTAYQQAHAQSIVIDTAVPTKDRVDVTGTYKTGGKIFQSGLLQLKSGAMSPWKDYGAINGTKMDGMGGWTYTATTMISVPKGTYDCRMALTLNTDPPIYSNIKTGLVVPGP